jgi:outer membrane protease
VKTTIPAFFYPVMIFLFFINLPLEAEDAGPGKPSFSYVFSSTLNAGFLYGQAEEMVYKNPENDDYLSQLIWDMYPLFYVGSSLDFSRINPGEGIGFFSDLTLKFGIPGKTGYMEDRDWLAVDGYLTHFSIHHNYIQGSLLLDFTLGLSFPVSRRMLLKAYGTLAYMSLSWNARDGYFQYAAEEENSYPPWEESIPKTFMFGSVINYSQRWFIITPGLSFSVSLFSFLGLEFSFQMSPFIFCSAWDEHIYNMTIYEDNTSGSVYYEPRGKLIFSPHERVELSLELSYRATRGSRGVSYYQTNILDSYNRTDDFDNAGAAYSALDTGLSVTVRF